MTRKKMLVTENSKTALTGYENESCQVQTRNQYITALIATLSSTAAGMCLVWTSPVEPLFENLNIYPVGQVTKQHISWMASLLTLGACLGAIPAGMIAQAIGRKMLLLVLSVPFCISWALIAFSGCLWSLYGARFLAGIAIGAASVAAPMYVAEIAHTSVRGKLGTFFQMQMTVGILLEYILGGIVHDFKLLALMSSLIPVVFIISFSFMPETPVYLYSKGRVDDARKALVWLRGDNCNIEEELEAIMDAIKEATMNKAKASDLINCKATFKGLIISLGLMVFQQLSGINAVLFFADSIFRESGTSIPPSICSILIGAVQVVATFSSSLLIERAGRKVLLLISSFVMFICLLCLGLYFQLKITIDLSFLSFVPLVSLAAFIIVFSIGFGPIPWMMVGEIFAPKTRGIAGSLGAFVSWMLAFTVTNQFQNLISLVGNGITFGIFALICGLATIFVAILVPETKGRTIEEVQNILIGRKCVRCDENCEKKTTIV